MAGGWARDGAVQEQIDDTVADAVMGARARLPAGEGLEHCEECGEPIPERRRLALPGTRTCVALPVRPRRPRRAAPASTAAAARTASCARPKGPVFMTVKAYGAYAADKPLEPMDIERRAPGPRDVQIEIAYCGVCHSDLHTVRSEWGGTLYPCVPGHEIVGQVTAVGADVAELQGRRHGRASAAWSTAASIAAPATRGSSNIARTASSAPTTAPTADPPGHTLGGYSQRIVVDEKFVLKIRHPEEQLAAVAPLLCAGITTYSPLRHWNVGPGKKVGIVGIGGLGHMGVKLAHAMGAARRRLHHVGEQARRTRSTLGARRGRGVAQPGRDDGARRQLRLHPQHGRREPRSRCLSPGCSSATARCAWSACPSIRIRRPTSAP